MTAVAVTTRKDAATAILAAVEQREPELLALAGRGAEAHQFYAELKLYFANNDKILLCKPSSVAIAMLRVAQTGLRLGVTCDILPFGGDAQFSPRYTGLIQLALASGSRSVNADVVREGDYFEYEKGTQFFLKHRNEAPANAKITHAYALAELKPGSFAFVVLQAEEVDSIRQRFSKQWKGGTLESVAWYAKKTAVRRLAPFLPQNPKFAAALLFEEREEVPPDAPGGELTGELDDVEIRALKAPRARPQIQAGAPGDPYGENAVHATVRNEGGLQVVAGEVVE